jgi:hypothetical protein
MTSTKKGTPKSAFFHACKKPNKRTVQHGVLNMAAVPVPEYPASPLCNLTNHNFWFKHLPPDSNFDCREYLPSQVANRGIKCSVKRDSTSLSSIPLRFHCAKQSLRKPESIQLNMLFQFCTFPPVFDSVRSLPSKSRRLKINFGKSWVRLLFCSHTVLPAFSAL